MAERRARPGMHERQPVGRAQQQRQRVEAEDRQSGTQQREPGARCGRNQRRLRNRGPHQQRRGQRAHDPSRDQSPNAPDPEQRDAESAPDQRLQGLGAAHRSKAAVGAQRRAQVEHRQLQHRGRQHEARRAPAEGGGQLSSARARQQQHEQREHDGSRERDAPRAGHLQPRGGLLAAFHRRRQPEVEPLQRSGRGEISVVEDQVQGVPAAEALRPERRGREHAAHQHHGAGQVLAQRDPGRRAQHGARGTHREAPPGRWWDWRGCPRIRPRMHPEALNP